MTDTSRARSWTLDGDIHVHVYTPWTPQTIQQHAEDMARKQARALELARATLLAKGRV